MSYCKPNVLPKRVQNWMFMVALAARIDGLSIFAATDRPEDDESMHRVDVTNGWAFVGVSHVRKPKFEWVYPAKALSVAAPRGLGSSISGASLPRLPEWTASPKKSSWSVTRQLPFEKKNGQLQRLRDALELRQGQSCLNISCMQTDIVSKPN
jgi:hypothetical protein